MTEYVLVLILLLFVAWGARTHPNRSFSWGMYSRSTKGFLWTEVAGRPRVLSYDELRLAPDSHFLSLPEFRRLMEQVPQPTPVLGLIIGSQGNWLVTYDDGVRKETPLPAGAELDQLVALLRRFPR